MHLSASTHAVAEQGILGSAQRRQWSVIDWASIPTMDRSLCRHLHSSRSRRYREHYINTSQVYSFKTYKNPGTRSDMLLSRFTGGTAM